MILSDMTVQAVPREQARRINPLVRRARTATASLGLIMALAACGGETEPAIGGDTLVSTTTTIATTTVPPETTTTINFDREPDQDDMPLPEDATALELFEVINDMRGPTDDASEQLSRLVTFLELASPDRAQILDFSVGVEPVDDDRNDISIEIRMRAPQSTEELASFYDGELRSAGWNKAAFNETTTDGLPGTELTYRIPGTSGTETELGIVLSKGPVSIIDIDYVSLSEEDDVSFERLTAWQSAIRVPRTAIANEAVVLTVDDTASLQVIYALEADTAAEAREDIVDLVRDDEFTIASPDGSGTSTAPVLLIDEDGQEYLLDFAPTRNPELFWMAVSATADLEPVED